MAQYGQGAVYLDYNGTTPLAPEVWMAMSKAMPHFGNPSSSHVFGAEPRAAMAAARAHVARLLHCSAEEILFTSGGTESDNLAIKGIYRGRKSAGTHIVSSVIEHPAVENVLCYLEENEGAQVTRLSVDKTGRVDVKDLVAAIRENTTLVTIMHSNNELGTLQPIKEIAQACRRANADIVVHTDASQSIGKVKIDVQELGVDLVTVAGHKLYAPKGVGALFVRARVRGWLQPILHGAPQESGIRPGTENVLFAVALGEACRIAHQLLSLEQSGRDSHSSALRELFLSTLTHKLGTATSVIVNGHASERLPNTLNISILNVPSCELLPAIASSVACSAGAACHSRPSDNGKESSPHISATLRAINMPVQQCLETIRVSTGRFLSEEETIRGANVIAEAALDILARRS